MSTVCKLDPEVRRRRTARAILLNTNHQFATGDGRAEAAAVLVELSLIKASSRLTGAVKHELFTRGAAQLAKCK